MAYTIGNDLEPIQLIFQRGRDFRWAFENIDDDDRPAEFPDGQLFFELQTRGEHNARQRVRVIEASGGTYKLGVLGTFSSPIDYYDSVSNPHNMTGDITDALEAIPTVGYGNVELTPAELFPAWELNIALNSGFTFSEQVVNVLNKSINDFFDSFEQLLGVDVDLYVIDGSHCRISVTGRRAFEEDALITFAVNVIGSAVRDFLNAVSGLVGAVQQVNVDFYWIHEFEVEFVRSLGNQEIPKMTVDTSGLTGMGGGARVEIDVLEPGKGPLTIWQFEIEDSVATLAVQSEQADLIKPRTRWQLVFLPAGEAAGGEALARGTVTVQL